WGSIDVSGFRGEQRIPPFDQAHLVAELSPVQTHGSDLATKTTSNTKTGSQTYLTYQLVVLNNGNLTYHGAGGKGRLHFYLSQDKTLNLQSNTGPGNSINPADIPLTIGPSNGVAFIPDLPPNTSVLYTFDKTSRGDFRLMPPPNSPASGDVTSG